MALIEAIKPLPGLGKSQFYNKRTKYVCALGALGIRKDVSIDDSKWQMGVILGLTQYDDEFGWNLTYAGAEVAEVNDAKHDRPAARKKRVLAWLDSLWENDPYS